MKFLCDRCKTRYSIGDERVRGKILKIRCKHCSNVITVREGMSAETEGSIASPLPDRARPRSTTMSPEVMDEQAASGLLKIGARNDGPSTVPLRAPSAAIKPVTTPGLPAIAPARDRGVPGVPGVIPSLGAGASVGASGGVSAGASTEPGIKRTANLRTDAGARPAFKAASTSAGVPAPAQVAKPPTPQVAPAPPPPALEEEWYVSIDGDQSGPFSLSEAKRWVAGKSADADLHCWSEGFDDWLPVDKVGHFRGLRTKPIPPPSTGAPPPTPRTRPSPASSGPTSGPSEDTPKPLFAATMASLERGASTNPGVAPRASATPPHGHSVGNGIAASNGAASRARPAPHHDAFNLGTDLGADDPDSKTVLQGQPLSLNRPTPSPLAPVSPLPPMSPLGSGLPLASDGPTVPSPPPSAMAPSTSFSVPPPSPSETLLGTGMRPVDEPALATDFPSAGGLSSDFGDDLQIGEVSRVVNLADLARSARASQQPVRRPTGANPSLRATGANPSLRATGAQPALGRSTGPAPALPFDPLAPPVPGPDGMLDPMAPPAAFGAVGTLVAPTPSDAIPPVNVAKSHRRGLIALLSVAVVLVLGVILTLTLIGSPNNDDTTGGSNLGTVNSIDTSRPDDPTVHRPSVPVGSAGSAAVVPPGGHTNPNPNPQVQQHHVDKNPTPEVPSADSLRSDEIEDTARKHQDMTQRCYMRSQRGADAIIVGDVKKIAVTMAIEKDGSVTDVQLSDHAADTLGKCLSTSIKTWKFRASSGGRFKFSLNFVSG